MPDWSDESPWARFKRGFSLIGYWAFGGLVKAVFRGEFPSRTAVALSIAGLLLLLWYFTVIVVLARAYLEGGGGMPKFLTDWMAGSEWATALISRIEAYGSTQFVVFVIGLLGMGRIESLANASGFLKAYLRDDPLGEGEVGVRAKARQRVLAVLDHVHGMKPGAGDAVGGRTYSEVFVVAHSLGGPIAVDALAEYGTALERTTLFTWGSALGALVQQEPLIESEIGKFYTSKTKISNWVDVVFRKDWMGSIVPVPRKAPGEWKLARYKPIFPKTVQPPIPAGQGLRMTRIHEAYYRSEEAVLMLVGQSAELPRRQDSAGEDDAPVPKP